MTPAARREALVDATLSCLKRYGHAGVSVRRISAAAGVSIGLINHHFPSKSGLVAETYKTLALSLQDSMRRRDDDRATSARNRLSAFFRTMFAPERLDPELLNVWLVFRSMVAHSPEVREVHDQTHGKYRVMLETLLGQLPQSGSVPHFKLRPAAVALTALLDGLWMELSLSRSTFKPREAVALCEEWVNALCDGAFPRLLRAPRAGERNPGAATRRSAVRTARAGP